VLFDSGGRQITSNPQHKAVVVLPTYNEGGSIQSVVTGILDQQTEISTHALHILVVDSRSTDGTLDQLAKLQKKHAAVSLLDCPQRGLGRAYIVGFQHAMDQLNPDLIIQMDCDGQHDPANIPMFIHIIQHGFDCVIGSRFVSGSQMVQFSRYRTLISKLGNGLIRWSGRIAIRDCTSGYRCMRASILKQCQFSRFRTTGYSFQSSLVSELTRRNARVMEYPIIFDERAHGVSKLRMADKWGFMLNMLFIFMNRRRQ
jgi:dolichol-phosphate mannosyltransferase